jgi:hypothetical protein
MFLFYFNPFLEEIVRFIFAVHKKSTSVYMVVRKRFRIYVPSFCNPGQ